MVIKRAISQRMLVAAAALTALLATTVLTALAGYTLSVTGEGLRGTLAASSFAQSGTVVSTTTGSASFAGTDKKVRAALSDVYRDVPLTVSLTGRGDSYTLPGQQGRKHPDLTTVATYGGIEKHARLLSGRWPREGATEAVLPAPAAKAMKVRAGQTLPLKPRVSGGDPVRVLVTGTFTATPGAYLWQGDRLVTTGLSRGEYTTYGPLVVQPGTYIAQFANQTSVSWLVQPKTEKIGSGELNDLAGRADGLGKRLTSASASPVTAKSGLPELLRQTDRALLVSRSTMLIPALQLIVLAAYSLFLLSRLLAEHRRGEVALLRARGATRLQLGWLALRESLLIALPAAVITPFLAPPLLRLTANAPWATKLDLDSAPAPLPVVIGSAIACALVVAAPSIRDTRLSYVETYATRGRGARSGAIQRAGGDLALVVVAALAVWQLARYDGPVTDGTGAGQGIDPLIVAGPAIALLAGGLLAMRLVPVLSRLAERAASGGRGFAPALGAWQVSRRPLRYAGPALLLAMAVAVGVLSVVTGATWRQSQTDQADFQTGPDLRVTAPSGPASPTVLGQGARYAGLPSIAAASPVTRSSANSTGGQATLLAADASKLGALLPEGATTGTIRSASRALASARPPAVQAPLEGNPAQLSVDLRIGTPQARTRAQFRVSVLLKDALAVPHEVELGKIPGDGKPHRLAADLAKLAGQDGKIAYPLAVRGARVGYDAIELSEPVRLSIDAIRGDNRPAKLPATAGWQGIFDADVSTGQPPKARVKRTGRSLLATTLISPYEYEAWDDTQVTLNALLGATGPPATKVPAVVTADLAKRAGVSVGGTVNVSTPTWRENVKVAAIVPALPSVPANQTAVLVDWDTYAEITLVKSQLTNQPGEWWLAAHGARTAAATHALRAHPDWAAASADRMALRRELRDAPLGGSMQGALILGFLAALALAVIGFVVNAIATARERLTEFAVLRALGTGNRQIFGLLGVEQAFLAGIGLAGGVLLGLVVARLVVEHIVLTAGASQPYPPAVAVVAWPPVIALLGAIIAVLCVLLIVVASWLRRRGLGQALRIGEDG